MIKIFCISCNMCVCVCVRTLIESRRQGCFWSFKKPEGSPSRLQQRSLFGFGYKWTGVFQRQERLWATWIGEYCCIEQLATSSLADGDRFGAICDFCGLWVTPFHSYLWAGVSARVRTKRFRAIGKAFWEQWVQPSVDQLPRTNQEGMLWKQSHVALGFFGQSVWLWERTKMPVGPQLALHSCCVSNHFATGSQSTCGRHHFPPTLRRISSCEWGRHFVHFRSCWWIVWT